MATLALAEVDKYAILQEQRKLVCAVLIRCCTSGDYFDALQVWTYHTPYPGWSLYCKRDHMIGHRMPTPAAN
jgi:hypothetical protein